MKPKRILYVAATSKGGSAFSLFHMMRGLDRAKYDPSVVFYASQNSFIESRMRESQIQATFITRNNLSETTQPPQQSNTTAQSRDTGRWIESRFGARAAQTYRWFRAHYLYIRDDRPRVAPLVQLVREHKIDLIHFNNSLRSAKPAVEAARRTGTPCVCHVRGFTDLSPYDLRFARHVDLFVFISRAVEQDCRRQGIATTGVVVHNVVDLAEFPSAAARSPDADAVRAEFGWAPGTPVVGVVGRLDWWKGHETFLQAVSQAAARASDLKALIVGAPVDTPRSVRYYQGLQELTRSLGLEDKVAFTGFRSDVARLMSAMDIVVLSSSTPEPFGRVVIEGMAAYKPVVATAAGGVLDIIRDRVDGRLVPIQDPQAMSQAIVELVAHPERAEKMGQEARRRVEAKFTLPRQVATLQQIYSTLLDTPPRDRAHIQWQNILNPPGLSTSH
jgi:glycosyltransferase involved in cell wall biosynthesis